MQMGVPIVNPEYRMLFGGRSIAAPASS